MSKLTNTFEEIDNALISVNFKAIFNGPPLVFPYSADADVMINPTISADNVPTIPSAQVIGRQDYTKFQLQSSRDSYLSEFSGYLVSESPSGAVVSVVRSFETNSRYIELQYRYTQGDCHVFVDGEILSQFSLSSALNQPRWFKLDLGGEKLRRVYVVSREALHGGIAVDASSVIYPTRDRGPSIGVLGDSITAGTGSEYGKNFVSNIAWKLGSWDTANFGIGGSGYINDAGSGKFINRIQEIADAGHDYLMVAGGINDLNEGSVSDFQTAVDEFYAEALTLFDARKVIIISNWSNQATTNGSETTEFRDVLKNKAEQLGCVFIDAIRDSETSWLTGNGKVGSENGTGNCDVMITEDGTHPTNDGHLLYGHNIATELLGGAAKL